MGFRQKKGSKTEVSKRDISTKKREREREREESEQCNYLYKFSLLGHVRGGIYVLLFYKINIFFSILILGQSPILLFVSFSYKFY